MISKKVRKIVHERDSYGYPPYPNCVTCGTTGKHHLHHIGKRSQGGDDTEHNLINLCMVCHDIIHNEKPKVRKALQAKIDEHMIDKYGEDWNSEY